MLKSTKFALENSAEYLILLINRGIEHFEKKQFFHSKW